MEGKIFTIIAASFVAGAAAGGVGVYLYSKRYFKEQADLEIKEMADYYQHKYGELKEEQKDEKDIQNIEEEKPDKMQTNIEEISSIYERSDKQEVVDHTAYNQYFNSGDSSNTSSKKKKKKKQEVEPTGPVIVDSDYWDNPPEGYETKFLVYYDVDGVMIDEESENIIENGEDLIGKDNLDQADQYDNVIFVMNNEDKTLYHVTVEQMSYAEVGLDD